MNGWPRRALALMCLLAAAVAAAHKPTAQITSADHGGSVGHVLVAAQDLAAGTMLSGRNVRLAALPADVMPDGAVGSLAAGADRVVAAPVRRGEPITDARLLGPGLATGLSPPETRAVPVRLADGQTASLLRPGDRIDLFATPVDAGLGAAPASDAGGTAGSGETDAADGSPPGRSAKGRSGPGADGSSAGRAPVGGAADPGGTDTSAPTGGGARIGPGTGTSSDQPPNGPSARSGPTGSAGARPEAGGAPVGTAEQADGVAAATLLASGVRVLAVLVQDGTNLTDGVLVVVAASDRTARQLAAAGAQQRLSVAIRPP